MNKVLINVGSQLTSVRLYPFFDICHYTFTALQIRDDTQQHQTGKFLFSSSLVCSLDCFKSSLKC